MSVSLFAITSLVAFVTVCSAGVDFNVKAFPAELAVGDTLFIDVSITLPEGDTAYDIAEVPVPSVNGCTLLFTANSKERTYENGSFRLVMTTRYFLEAVDTGRTAVPSMTVDYVDTKSGMLTSLASQRIALHVSVRRSATSSTTWKVAVSVALTSAVLLTIVMLRHRRGRSVRETESSAEPDPKDTLRQACSRAEVVIAHGRMAEGQSILCDSLKSYLKGVYGFESDVETAALDLDQLEGAIQSTFKDSYIKLTAWSDELKYGGAARSGKELSDLCERLRSSLEQ